jgi:hypothetical protein
VVNLGRPRFSWGDSGYLTEASETRRRYLTALRIADRQSAYRELVDFARS